MKKFFNRERKGYAITFEVLITIVLMTMFLNATTWVLTTINTQRFINTTLISTAVSIAKWGGTNSKAYAVNGVSEDLIKTSQTYLNKYAPSFNVKIKGEPKVITPSNNEVSCSVEWTYPKIFGIQISNRQSKTIKLEGIMQPGSLLY